MRSKVRRDKNRLNLKSVREGAIVYNDGTDFFSRTFIRGSSFRLIKPVDRIISYIPDCWDETDDEDMDCHVMGYQKWIVDDLEFNIERKIVLHFFIAKWSTILNNPTLYNKISVDMDEDFNLLNELYG